MDGFLSIPFLMDKEYDAYLVIGSLLISFLTSFLAIAFASFIVWHKKNTSQWWLLGAAINMGLGIWAMHFVGMLALHLEIAVAFEPIRTIVSALFAIAASYAAFWVVLSADFKTLKQRQLYGTFVLGSGVASMHYLGMDAMQMFPKISYDPFLFVLSLIIAYVASYTGLNLFIRSANQIQHVLFSRANFISSVVIGVAVTGMHYTGMAAANFDYNSYCTVLEEGLQYGSLSILVIVSVIVVLLFSFILLAYEQHVEIQEHEQNRMMLRKVTQEVDKRTAELQRQTTMNERLLETMDAIVVVLDRDGVIQQFNLAAQFTTGYCISEVKGKQVWDVMVPREQVEEVKSVFSRLVSGMFPNKHQNDWITKQGSQVTIDWHNSAVLDDEGEVIYVIGTGLDVTQQLQDQEALQISAVAFETQEAMVVTDGEGLILKVNKAFEDITGYSLDEVEGKSMNILKSGRHGEIFYKKLWKSVDEKGYWQGEIWNRRKNGDVFPEWLRITRVLGKDNSVINYIGNFSDISQRKKIEQELEFLAFYDAVTELPNRRLFTDRLEQAIYKHQTSRENLAVMFVDLDNFKQINDTFGHAFGDKLLIEFSRVITKIMPGSVTISRFGGDEFVLLFSGLSENKDTAAFQSEQMAEVLLNSITSGLNIGEQNVYISSSIGITVSDCVDDTVSTLLMQADTAMYQAKEMGKNTFRFYSESIGESMAERFKMEVALRNDLSASTPSSSPFFVVYQPQYNAKKQVVGAEALVRWSSAELGFMSPAKFITVAEEVGIIDELGMFVVNRVLHDISNMAALFEKSTLDHVSINLSIKQLTNPTLTSRLLNAFQHESVSPDKVRFEFTESVFLDNALNPKALFSEMSEIGFTFALDDFGTGFSSLSYLKDLPISELKIDKTFVDGIPNEESDTTICSATISMAQKLGLQLVAEGVETEGQFDWLVAHGCNLLQGYLMSQPIEYKEFVSLLEKSHVD